MNIYPLKEKFKSFNFNTIEVVGHDIEKILDVFENKLDKEKTNIIIAKTIKGKGVSFMENVCGFHGVAPTLEELERALAELA